MKYIDIHAHLDETAFDADREDVIARVANDTIVVCNGVNPESNKKVLALAQKHPHIKCALGAYPLEVASDVKDGYFPPDHKKWDAMQNIEWIQEQLKNKDTRDQIVGIGEVGLDLAWSDSLRGQQEVFEEMCSLAIKKRLPVIVHSRKAEAECIDVMTSLGVKKANMHCFCGSKKLVRTVEEQGWMLSIPPNVVRASQFQMMVENVSITQLLTETDAPYLSYKKGERNEPYNVRFAVKKIAQIKGLTEEEVKNNIFKNYMSLI